MPIGTDNLSRYILARRGLDDRSGFGNGANLVRDGAGRLLISAWTITEVSSALAMKRRVGEMTLDQHAKAITTFDRMTSRSVTVLSVIDEFSALLRHSPVATSQS